MIALLLLMTLIVTYVSLMVNTILTATLVISIQENAYNASLRLILAILMRLVLMEFATKKCVLKDAKLAIIISRQIHLNAHLVRAKTKQ